MPAVEWSDLSPAAQWLLAQAHRSPRTLEQLTSDCPLGQLCEELPDGLRELRATALVTVDADGPVRTTHDGEALAAVHVD